MSLFRNNDTHNFDRDLAYTASPLQRQEQREVEKSFARLFAGDDGQRVLAYLQVLTFHKAMSPDVGSEHMRYTEGQRALVASILRLIERGRT